MPQTLCLIADPDAPDADGPRLEHFGPALVTAVLDRDVELKITGAPGGPRRWARLAIAITYQPQIGDIVLAMAAGGACYVVGVIEGRGTTTINAPGDLELRAPEGAIRIEAAFGCDIKTPALRAHAATIDLVGETLYEDFATVRRRISDTLDVTAKLIRTVVAESYRLTAQRIFQRGTDSVTVDAPSINLG